MYITGKVIYDNIYEANQYFFVFWDIARCFLYNLKHESITKSSNIYYDKIGEKYNESSSV